MSDPVTWAEASVFLGSFALLAFLVWFGWRGDR